MLYTFCCFDKPEAVGVRAANREAHLAFLSELATGCFWLDRSSVRMVRRWWAA